MDATWNKNIYSAIRNISDFNYQRKSWFGKSARHVSSFSEMVNILYDDCFFEDFMMEYSFVKGNSEFYLELKQFDELIENYNPTYDEREIIDDPKWHQIVNQAQIIMKIWDIYVN